MPPGPQSRAQGAFVFRPCPWVALQESQVGQGAGEGRESRWSQPKAPFAGDMAASFLLPRD